MVLLGLSAKLKSVVQKSYEKRRCSMLKLVTAICIVIAITAALFISGELLANGYYPGYFSDTGDSITWEKEQVTPYGTVVYFNGLTEAEILEKIKMSPEDEAKIVHEVPPCPVIIDGIKYEPEQVHLFDGQQLGFITGKDGQLYAFTTEEGIRRFRENQKILVPSVQEASVKMLDNMSHFYRDAFLAGDKLDLIYYASLSVMTSTWNNQISSLQTSSSCLYCRLYDYEYFQGDYHEVQSSTTELWLFYYGWNDRASSILHIYQ